MLARLPLWSLILVLSSGLPVAGVVAAAQTDASVQSKDISPVGDRSAVAQTVPRELLTVQGRLDENSQVLDDGSYANRHTFEGKAGEEVAIELVSEQFDAYVMLNDPQGQRVDDDNNSGSGRNALIGVTLPASGTYTVLANSYGEAETGEYRLMVRSVTAADQTAIEAEKLFQQGRQADRTSQFREALTSYQAALPLYRQIGYQLEEGTTLNNIGFVYNSLGRYEEALQQYQLALAIRREVGDSRGEGTTLNNIGFVYDSLGRYEEALQQYQLALAIFREVGNRSGEGTTLNNIGSVYNSLGRYEEALQQFQLALAIRREVGDRPGEGAILNDIGEAYASLRQYGEALQQYQQALIIRREVGNRPGESTTLNNIGQAYASLGRYEEALQQFQLALAISHEIGNRNREGAALNNIGQVYALLGRYEEALQQFQLALAISHEIGNRFGEGTTLNGMGGVYHSLGRYEEALQHYQQALTISREIGNRFGEGTTLNGIGLVYDSLGRYEEALQQFQQALAITHGVGDSLDESATLNNIGGAYYSLRRYEEALQQFQQVLVIIRKVGNRHREGTSLNNIGLTYNSLGLYEKALQHHQQALDISREVGDRPGEGNALHGIGRVYRSLGRYEEALQHYQQALAIHREVGDRDGQGTLLANIGKLLVQQNQPELAIVFLKQSVNVRETIRDDIRALSIDLRQSYAESIADDYRKLADLLFQQDRVLEAQRVLDLLKVQELEDYLRDVRGNGATAAGIANRPAEQAITDDLNTLLNNIITISRELAELESIPPNQRSAAQTDRLIELGKQATQVTQNFRDFLISQEVQARIAELRNTTDGESIELANYTDLQDNLSALQQNAVLLYPFVLEDRLELVLVTPEATAPIRKTVPIDRVTLNRVIGEYHSALKNPNSDPLPLAKQLYDWLIAPLQETLDTLEVQTIIYAPDGQLRYIPLAALHDGDQWLAQRFRINNITAASLTDLALSPRRDIQVFAGAFSEGNYEVPQGSNQFFTGLEFAGREVERLASLIPNTTKLLNRDFNLDTVQLMNSYSIVHLATHASFVSTNPEDSFIVFGDGQAVTLSAVRNWRMRNVELVVLSACETGLGDELGDGREILGLGYQVQRAGAKAVVASLWQVSDGGTQMLMDAFYAALNQGMTKAEALRQAQIALITGDLSPVGGIRGEASISVVSTATGLPANVSNNLDHPYYWAPFILIGNGL